MMNFMDNLEWYVMIHDFNGDKIRSFNIFNNVNLYSKRIGIPKLLKDYTCFEDFKEELNKLFKYCFMSKAEYEIIVKGLFERSESYKMDVYDQIKPNLDLIARYILTEYNKRKRKKLIIDRR